MLDNFTCYQKQVLLLVLSIRQSNMSSLTSWLLQFFAAEFGCGGCCWVMGRGTIGEHEVAVMKDLANTLLRCFSHLQHMDYHHSETSNNQSVTLQWEFKNSVSIFTITTSEG